MTTTVLFPSGALEICAVIDNQFTRKTYQGYTKQEAKTLFRAEFMGSKKKQVRA